MKNKAEDQALQTPENPTGDKHVNYFADDEAVTGRNKKENTESSNPGADSLPGSSMSDILAKEMRIDPGNEHHHRTDADDKIFDDDIDRSPRYEADSAEDSPGNPGFETGE